MAICIARATPTCNARAMTIVALLCLVFSAGRVVAESAGLEKIQHIIVIYQENWSFDGLYGKFPGADGIANAGERIRQTKKDGTPYRTLPQPLDTSKKPPIPDSRFPTDLPVAPYDIGQYVPPRQKIGDIVNRALQEKRQINGGQMDGFVAWSENGGLAMSYYDATDLPVGRLAQQYTLADRFFHSAFDGSMINHLWLICACTPTWSDAPAKLKIQIDAEGAVMKDGSVTPDGYVVHTVYPANPPYPANIEPSQLMPLLNLPTIGDRLSEKGVSWAWYSGGWKDAVAGHPDALFQFHHQPFNYFAPYAEGRAARTRVPKGHRGFPCSTEGWQPAGRSVYHADWRRQRTSGLLGLAARTAARGKLGESGAGKYRLEGQRNHRHLRRGWRTLGSCSAAARRSLGSRGSHSGDYHLALCQTTFRRSHDL